MRCSYPVEQCWSWLKSRIRKQLDQFDSLRDAIESVLRLASGAALAVTIDHPDATLVELCELFAQKTGNWVSRAAMCRCATEIRTQSKKKTWYSSQATTERVQKLRVEYWEKSGDIEPENDRIFG